MREGIRVADIENLSEGMMVYFGTAPLLLRLYNRVCERLHIKSHVTIFKIEKIDREAGVIWSRKQS